MRISFPEKKYKQKEGEYEQIFWRTRTNLIQRKLKSKLTTRGSPELHVVIDKSERYSWSFRGCIVERRTLPAGDYALVSEDGLKAVVERKTFENLLAEFGRMHFFIRLWESSSFIAIRLWSLRRIIQISLIHKS